MKNGKRPVDVSHEFVIAIICPLGINILIIPNTRVRSLRVNLSINI